MVRNRSANSAAAAHPADAWDAYWQGTRETAAHDKGGALEPVLKTHWDTVFTRVLADCPDPLVLDIACGNGALADHARRHKADLQLICSDYSLGALRNLLQRAPDNLAVAADAFYPPFAAGSLDLLVSQFGIEYAGIEAIVAASDLVAPGGTLALVVHLREGAIHEECARNEALIRDIEACGLLARSAAAFRAGFALNPDDATTVDAFRQAERELAPALRTVEALLGTHGSAAAAGLAHRLYSDIAHMYRRMGAYELSDVLAWLEGMQGQLVAYRQRMAAMVAAGLEPAAIERIVSELSARDWRCCVNEGLRVADDAPQFAWALTLVRT
ncbi:MAG: class I SAM-dependent methyltransferase [Chromatocurvus sp.]